MRVHAWKSLPALAIALIAVLLLPHAALACQIEPEKEAAKLADSQQRMRELARDYATDADAVFVATVLDVVSDDNVDFKARLSAGSSTSIATGPKMADIPTPISAAHMGPSLRPFRDSRSERAPPQ